MTTGGVKRPRSLSLRICVLLSIRLERMTLQRLLSPEGRGGNLRRHRIAELHEVLGEHLCELRSLRVVRLGVAPRRARIEQPLVDTGNALGHVEPEDLVGAELDVVELAQERRDNIARVAPMGIRSPSPYGPPVQPVLTSQTVEPWRSSRSPSSSA